MDLNKKILVVDDDEGGRISLSKILQKEAYSVCEAKNGSEALNLIREGNFNLVITDLKMAKMDGLELLKAIKLTKPDIQVILITAYGPVESAVEAMKVGAFDFISKPLKRSEILRVVNQALEKQFLIIENKMLKLELESFKTGQVVIGNSVFVDKAGIVVRGVGVGVGNGPFVEADHLAQSGDDSLLVIVDRPVEGDLVAECHLAGFPAKG